MALPNDIPITITITSRQLRDIDGCDNCAYVSAELAGLSGLGGKEPSALVEKADELLGWARLACEHTKAHHLTSSPLDVFNAVMTNNHGQQDNLLYDMRHHVSTEIFTNIMRVTALARFCFVMAQIFCVLARPNPSFSMR
ncbi:hypothetical protein BDR05DRAFT_1006893 [Suillus weaverae]|nr:hypothetical protein BDR05DRAFT_1006893 [Suillus weaverae]